MSMRVRLRTGALLATLMVPLMVACGSSSPTSAAAPTAAPKPPVSPAAAPPAKSSAPGAETITTGKSSLGTILTDGGGRTLYLWEKDTSAKSNCYGACEQFWPPVLTTGAPVAGPSINTSLLGTSTRTDGKVQVTYNHHPLYYFVQDKRAGDTTGEESPAFGAKWYVVGTNGKKVEVSGS